MRKLIAVMLLLTWATGLSAHAEGNPPSLVADRAGFETELTKELRDEQPLEEPPPDVFQITKYPGRLGEMAAYITPDPGDGQKYPAIIWLTGGFPPGGGGSYLWTNADPEDDQSARAFRQNNVVMMFPSLRGESGNPGFQESGYGEVEDVLSAAAYLKSLDHVDGGRIYLGGHSTGATLALLAAASSDQFKSIFAYGPVARFSNYGPEVVTYDPANAEEDKRRAPIHYINSIRAPTVVIEGQHGNIGSFRELREATRNPRVTFIEVADGDHFSVLAPINRLLADLIASTPADRAFNVTTARAQAAYESFWKSVHESDDLFTLAQLRRGGVELAPPQVISFVHLSRDEAALRAAVEEAAGAGFAETSITEATDAEGDKYHVLTLKKRLSLKNVALLFEASQQARTLAKKHGVYYDGRTVDP